nr:hypothetical protein [Candidatus Shapirobacteria bacterium]
TGDTLGQSNSMSPEDVLQRKIRELEDAEVKKPQKFEGQIKIEPQQKEQPLRFVPPKTEIISQEPKQKPVFIKNEEVKVPQPPQLAKKPQPIFDSTKQSEKPEEKQKMDYDDLFGNGIV